MRIAASTLAAASPIRAKPEEPIGTLLLVFWGAFAFAAIALRVMNPDMFMRQDPDSLMRMVQVRDLLAGQNWFDLFQYRLDPPEGALMHWSRLIDAPLAGLVLLGNFFGDGEAFAMTAWPLLLLLGLMTSAISVGMALAGRGAVLPVLILSLLFFDPLLSYLPNDIDHHNAQIVLLVASLGLALRLRERPLFGLYSGLAAGLMLAIGLEMLPYIAVLGAVLALQWALSGKGGPGTAWFGLGFAAAPTALHFLSGSPDANWACDSLSWSYAIPAASAGLGLASVVGVCQHRQVSLRIVGLCVLAIVAGGAFALVAPACLAGPYGFISPELQRLWLDTITEAQPVYRYFSREPVGIMATLGPPIVALIVSARRALRADETTRHLWFLCAALIAAPLFLCLYQVRTLPYANAVALPVLAAWLAEVARRYGISSLRPFRQALPLVAAFLITMPAVHLGMGWAFVEAASLATGGRLAPRERPAAPPEAIAGLTPAEVDCLDTRSASLFAQVTPGVVLSPVFYGSGVLNISRHSVVAAPYHRQGEAILASIYAMDGTEEAAREIIATRGVDYVAICSTSRESALTVAEAPSGLLARLLDGASIAWLVPVPAAEPTGLRLWRVAPGEEPAA